MWLSRLLVVLVVFALSGPAEAQQTGKVYRIGYLGSGTQRQNPFLNAFEQGLREHGYAIGKNLIIEYRYAEGKFEQPPALAAELVRLDVDVIVTGINPAIVAAKQATSVAVLLTR
jgi:putative ABC transport system substrate-binding protein